MNDDHLEPRTAVTLIWACGLCGRRHEWFRQDLNLHRRFSEVLVCDGCGWRANVPDTPDQPGSSPG